MKVLDALSRRSPSAPAPLEASADRPAGARSVTSFLLARGLDVKRESVRVVSGFALLLMLAVVVLNVTLWHKAWQRIEAEA